MPEEYQRFTVNQRVQHIILLVTFVLLVITGLPLKYRWTWGHEVLESLGGIIVAKSIHRWAALGMTAIGAWHVFFYLIVDRGRKKIIPGKKDFSDFKQLILYGFGRVGKPPKFDRFNFAQKFDYWGAFWGLVIMIGAGAVMWWPWNFSFLPLWIIESLRVAHAEEAILAAVFIFTVHMYSSHLRGEVFPMDKVFITGKLSKERMVDEHPLEYEEMTRKEG